ncbi:MAG TPA: aldehyde dehydrogenase family protein [Ilumatobacteraceae bacterium]|nr:aldehyde dehydrogenase family protein [Ilumatobacteraceae bacterium]
MHDWTKQYIDGQWVESHEARTIDVINPTTEQVIARVSAGHADDVDAAVRAAARAFPAWSATTPEERADFLRRLIAAVKERHEVFAQLITAEVGTPIRTARVIQAGLGVVDLEGALEALENFEWREPLRTSVIVREPIGVVGAITPWNYPLHQITAKIGAAIGAGCTVVLKPSEVAPGCAFELTSIIHDLGLPAGVFNVVCGEGQTVGEPLVSHELVDMVTFTGSNKVGKRISELAAATVKRVALELGGKSASLIAPDADLASAVAQTVRGCYINTGQSCSALSRMLVQRDQLAEVEQLTVQAVAGYQPGDPADDQTKLGPIVSAAQQERVLGFIRGAIDEGAQLLTGGLDRPESAPDTGYFVAPTVFTGVDASMTIANEEVFGPVMVIMPYDTEEEAVELANATKYGLAAAVWAGTPERAEHLALQMRAAQVSVNGGQFNSVAPFGGYKQSGLGREGGTFGFEEFLEVKSLQY